MNKERIFSGLAIAAAFTLFVAGATAHHSLTGDYDTSATATLEGVIREFHFVNPHPYITVEIRRNGRTERWKMEMDNRGELAAIGMTATTFKNSDRITVTGSPGRSAAKILYIRKLERPGDGFWYEQDGMEPRMGFSKG
jgi:hypothetical protein